MYTSPIVYCFLCLLQTDKREEGTEFVVTNVDQGNTFAGELLKKLICSVKTFCTQLEAFEELLKKSASQEDIADLKKTIMNNVKKFEKHCEEEAAMMQDMQKSSNVTHLSQKNEELRSELKATKEKYDEIIATLSENIKAKESELSYKITRLSKENEDLRSELKAMKEEHDEKIKSLSENIEKIRQPSLEGDAAGATASTPITALLSTLDQLATQMVPKETTNKRRSMIESHDNELRTAHGLPSQDSFDDSITGSPPIARTYSASSSGRGTLNRGDSNKPLFSIDEDEPSQSEDQVSSQATDVQQSLPPLASKVLLCQNKTSTPAFNRTQSIIMEKQHDYLKVVWAMSDLTVAIKKLLETDSSN